MPAAQHIKKVGGPLSSKLLVTRLVIIVAAVFWLAGRSPAWANNCPNYSYQLTHGTTADASQAMSNFNTIYNCAYYFSGGTSTGTASSQIVSSVVPSIYSLFVGNRVTFESGFDSTGPLTLNVAGTGNLAVTKRSAGATIAIAAGDMKANQVYTVQYTGSQYVLLDPLPSTAASNSFVVPFGSKILPGGRLTVQTGSAVQTSGHSIHSIYYHTYISNLVPVESTSGTILLPIPGNELGMALASPHVGTNWLQDIYAFSDNGTLSMCVAPNWGSYTTRPSSLAIVNQNGLWVNANAFNGACYGGSDGNTAYTIPAYQGTLLGTLAPEVDSGAYMNLLGPGGSFFGVSNAYNRIPMKFSIPTAGTIASWTNSSSTWAAPALGTFPPSTYQQLAAYVADGLGQSFVKAVYSVPVQGSSTSTSCSVGIGVVLPSTTPAPSPQNASTAATAVAGTGLATVSSASSFYPTPGKFIVVSLEAASGGTCTFEASESALHNALFTVEFMN